MSSSVEPGWPLMKYGTRYCSLPASSLAQAERLGEALVALDAGLLHLVEHVAASLCSGATESWPPVWCCASSRDVLGAALGEVVAHAATR